jgi:hypothetical protein
LLKGFLKKVSADGSQVVAEEVAEPEALFGLQIFFTFERKRQRKPPVAGVNMVVK